MKCLQDITAAIAIAAGIALMILGVWPAHAEMNREAIRQEVIRGCKQLADLQFHSVRHRWCVAHGDDSAACWRSLPDYCQAAAARGAGWTPPKCGPWGVPYEGACE
jgi:hypothetical protein